MTLSMEYGLWIVFAGILLDNAGLPLPGELLLLMFGVLSRYTDLNLGVLLLVASAAAVGGDSFGYWLGRLGGNRVLHVYCRATLGSPECPQKAAQYYARYGTATVIFGRFLVGIRVFLSPLAGSVGLPFVRFLCLDFVGALLWTSVFVLAGYAIGGRLDSLEAGYRIAYVAVGIATAAGIVLYFWAALRYRRRQSARLTQLADAPAPEPPS
jgi:membrane protein DedA with SNARE-associated domain